jgi:hypothetical protein
MYFRIISISLLILCSLIISCSDSSAPVQVLDINPTPFLSGVGEPHSPYQITTLEQLQAVRDYPERYFILTYDIDASATETWNDGAGFLPLGSEESPFSGTFDGNGHTVKNLYLNHDIRDVGLFGYVRGAQIENLTISGANVTGKDFTGGLAGRAIISSFKNIRIEGDITSSNYSGLLAGAAERVVFQNIRVSGSATGILTGGISGRARFIDADDIHAEVSVNGRDYSGGLFGLLWATLTTNAISNCSSDSDVVSIEGNAGGITGFDARADFNSEPLIINCTTSGKVTGRFAGGLVGGGATNISYSSSSADVFGEIYAGGLLGGMNRVDMINFRIYRSHTNGNVSVSETQCGESDGNAGGLIGKAGNVHILKSFSEGAVAGRNGVGGLVGEMFNGSISKSFSTGEISACAYSGGLVGFIWNNAAIHNSYSLGSVSSDNGLRGGIVGLSFTFADISEVYAAGMVTEANLTGALAGVLSAPLKNSYWSSELSGTEVAAGDLITRNETSGELINISQLMPEDMQGPGARENMPSFDWDNTWDTSDTFPVLKWQNEQ